MKHAGDIEGKSAAELARLSEELATQFFTLRLQKAAGALKTTADLQKTKRQRARVLTELGRQLRSGKAEAK